jgi:hypothetical protein
VNKYLKKKQNLIAIEGTSIRKSRLNPVVVQQQTIIQKLAIQQHNLHEKQVPSLSVFSFFFHEL